MFKLKKAFFENTRTSVITLIALTFLVYIKCLFYQFSPMDEDWLIIRGESFIKDWGNLGSAFSDSIQKIYYRPLLIWTFVFDYHIGHLAPFIYHLTNILLHVFCVIVLYKLLIALKTDRIIAFFLAAIFSVHPLGLHAVAWIPGRNDVLLCLFSLLSIFHLVLFLRDQKNKNALLHFLFFMMALFSKENAVFLLPVFIFILFVIEPTDRKKAMIIGLVWIAQFALWYFLMNRVIKVAIGSGTDILTTLKDFIAGFLIFIGKAFIPIQQSVSPNIENSGIEIVLGVVVIVLLIYLVFKKTFNNRKIAIFGLFIYFSLLAVPVWFGAVSPIGEHLEHRTYTSIIGMFVFISQLKLNVNSERVKIILLLVVIIFSTKTFIRMGIYKDGFSYLTEAAADCPKNYFFQSRLGNFLFDAGKVVQSIDCYNKAIALYDKRPQVYNYRANSYVILGKKEEAIADFTKAYELSGFDPKMLYYRWLTYKRFGDIENALKDSITLRGGAVRVPGSKNTTMDFLNAQLKELNKMIVTEPNNAVLYINRAKAYVDMRMGKEALADLKKACELEPENKEYKGYYNELYSSLPH